MFQSNSKELIRFINQFKELLSNWSINECIDYVKHNESGLALQFLSEYLYEENVFVNESLKKSYIGFANQYKVSKTYWSYMGASIPYPDLSSQLTESEQFDLSEPTDEKIVQLQRNGNSVMAFRMCRELYELNLPEAQDKIKELLSK